MIKLYTSDGHFVAKVEPLLPLPISEVLIWGLRVFVQAPEGRWIETTPTVVIDPKKEN